MLSNQEITQYEQAVQTSRQAPETRGKAEELQARHRKKQIKQLVKTITCREDHERA